MQSDKLPKCSFLACACWFFTYILKMLGFSFMNTHIQIAQVEQSAWMSRGQSGYIYYTETADCVHTKMNRLGIDWTRVWWVYTMFGVLLSQ